MNVEKENRETVHAERYHKELIILETSFTHFSTMILECPLYLKDGFDNPRLSS